MARKSAASLAVIQRAAGASRLRPPPTLSEAESTIFVDLAGAVPANHFRQSDLPLLVQYVQAIALANEASGQMRAEGAVIGGKVSPWLAVQEKAQRAIVALSMRLRLSPQARAPRAKADSRPPGLVAPWE